MSNFKPNLAAVLPAAGSDSEVAELPIPNVEADEILIENKAIALNHMDWKRQTYGILIRSYPVVLGTDVAGVVVKVGSSVTAFKPGDRVLGLAHGFMTGKNDNSALQTYVAIKGNLASPIPDNISFSQAVSVALSTVTSSIGLFDTLGVPAPALLANTSTDGEQKQKSGLLLVWGGASSMGSMAIQLARLAGLTVLATANPANHERLRAIGASVVVDYRSPTAVQELVAAAADLAKTQGTGPLTMAMDTVGTEKTLRATEQVLKLAGGAGATQKLVHLPMRPQGLEIGGGSLEVEQVHGERAFTDRQDFVAGLYHNALPKWLGDSSIVPSGFKVVDGGLGGVQAALNALKAGGTAEKLVVEL